VPEERYCVLFSWVPGTSLNKRLSLENMRRFGALAATLHRHAAGFHPSPELLTRARYDRVFPFEEPAVLFTEQYASLLPASRRQIFQEAYDRVQEAIEKLKSCGEPMRLLHGDLHRWNVRVYRTRLGVLDFEDMTWGWPVQDIGTTLLYFYGDEHYEIYRNAFIEGYQREADWPEREMGEVDTFIIGRNLTLANFVMLEKVPEWQEMAPRYFARVERRLRSLMYGEAVFNPEEW
jgi:Ser/Thr protein kinase RdoA (MazF antagonist)